MSKPVVACVAAKVGNFTWQAFRWKYRALWNSELATSITRKRIIALVERVAFACHHD